MFLITILVEEICKFREMAISLKPFCWLINLNPNLFNLKGMLSIFSHFDNLKESPLSGLYS